MQANGSNAQGQGSAGSASGSGALDASSPKTSAAEAGLRKFKYSIASDFVESRKIQDEIMAAVAQAGFTDDEVFAIRLALEEAMINAIKHGNKHDPAKVVSVEASVSGDALEVIIHDQGAGFDRASVPDPLAEENLEKNSGRGILLIESYMDSAEWTDEGRRLRMLKKRVPVAVG